ncbi:hypothetical protein GQR58_029917 [Nymphon striatum]|nr:hypothetical protein GQR58_029917 [Nymphon striatum]
MAIFLRSRRPSSIRSVSGCLVAPLMLDIQCVLRTRHIDGNTIVHEIFHTFEWDSIDWESDVFNQFFSSRGRTIAFYESAANWGTQEYTASDPTNSGGYNSGYTREDWFADPTAPFLNYSEFLPVDRSCHAGVIPLPDPTNESGGFVVDMIKAYADDGLVAGQDPWDLLRSQVESGDLGAPGEKPLSLAWPRMWMALYLLRDTSATNADGDLLVDQYPWAVFKDSETARWRQVFDSGENPLGDSYGYGRPARKALTSVSNGFTEMPQVSVSPGGALRDASRVRNRTIHDRAHARQRSRSVRGIPHAVRRLDRTDPMRSGTARVGSCARPDRACVRGRVHARLSKGHCGRHQREPGRAVLRLGWRWRRRGVPCRCERDGESTATDREAGFAGRTVGGPVRLDGRADDWHR